ncbi:hypothetical protein [Oceanobacillus salinisoli]|uniref:hypothetical protein n=1 Tax=Oceanobacillus salinisoli TaxID=2678611 RepID=UPI0012E12E7F|nr:hypothetical protein [Oceanobacillus salinisoli]
MKKSTMYTAMGVIGAAIGTVAVQSIFKDRGQTVEQKHSSLVNAGIPDQSSEVDEVQMENAKMVSEGSQFGVHYYNEWNES